MHHLLEYGVVNWASEMTSYPYSVVLLRFSKSCKQSVLAGFVKKTWFRIQFQFLDDSIIHTYTDVWFSIHTSNGQKWHKSIPLADTTSTVMN